ncbi:MULTISPECIES: hypothetical protein [unclassified Candidatus Frackibacter]|uniref:hypothetical protein n=1 Tax=unclassified Candidatus Frackibacter TaxID=2648818 RepID=UPI000884080E|nr:MULTISPECIES: hypothetical protein [unclassified Candidatus Frackibacter]SDC16633.1 hypothetical protein SAMN04515661_10363 [Candidatus Frackibacter sp. WG11]SEM45085.1 hypothetical protein SAMN04488698_10479 [Candidatus Frackibacter sp. WG12]SFL47473.1 hypothetical protein SAMN04488699_10377 [Candidatus Frackibacter sp. WG13]
MSTAENNSVITHKELLTFSNLTNLEWEFVGLTSGDSDDEKKRSTQLNDLLNPELFVRYDADSDSYFYPYLKGKTGKNINLTDEDREKGKAELRKHAGIAMEYLEKWQRWQDTSEKEGTDEGSFLGDWEVIYAADNYKIIADFFDDLYAAKYGEEPNPAERPYSSRGELDDKKKAMTTLEIITKGVDIAATLLPIAVEIKFADEVLGIKKTSYADDILPDVNKTLEKITTGDKLFQLDEILELSEKRCALASIYSSSKIIIVDS